MSGSGMENLSEPEESQEVVEESAAGGVEEPASAPSAENDAAAAAANEERRRTYRLNKVLGATLTASDGESKTTRLFVIDISVTGFRATDHQPPNQEECEISIILAKGEEPFQSRVRVVWVKELTVSGMFQMGCEFVDCAAEQEAKLSEFIESERRKAESAASAPKDPGFGRPWTMIN